LLDANNAFAAKLDLGFVWDCELLTGSCCLTTLGGVITSSVLIPNMISTPTSCRQFTLIGKYSNSVSERSATSTIGKSRELCIQLASNVVVTPNRSIPLNLSFKHSWIQSCINLKTPVDVVDIEGANTIEFKYAFANDSINSSGLIKHIHIWNHHPVAVRLCEASEWKKNLITVLIWPVDLR
jgi:hypothetical protein